ncbi:MAG: UDP-glucose 4-epimerase GalE [Lewinella sp.]|nr:UDP-glucose 4-epimerase GalE [Lewinella sp.]
MSKGHILVTGGCGYIGSHTIVDLLENGYQVTCLDSLVNAQEKVVAAIRQTVLALTHAGERPEQPTTTQKAGLEPSVFADRFNFVKLDLAERAPTLAFFQQQRFTGVIHFAALKLVGESVLRPLDYFRNNLNSLLNVIEGQAASGGSNLVFSSSCSVYGNAEVLPVTEQSPRQEAQSPYARSKQMGEDIIFDYCKSYPDFGAMVLRYFNPAGAHNRGFLGEDPRNPPSNLVPVITEVAAGKRPDLVVFGSDYPTRDGSALRDYIHVMDLARAHTLALEKLLAGKIEKNPEVVNLGIGKGLTVLEVINAFEEVTGRPLHFRLGPRRPGDVAAIYADNQRAFDLLGWQPQRGVADIMASAWAWEQKRSSG